MLEQLLKEKDITVNDLAGKTVISPSTLYIIIRKDNMIILICASLWMLAANLLPMALRTLQTSLPK
ncbi:MAG: helix-turn-helix domain-containing protein [Acidaminococcaceae bacterium]